MSDLDAETWAEIVKNQELHAKWLNTASYLEYIGFRKIVKSQQASSLDIETMKHMIEEGRHALLLKNLAIRTGGSRFNDYSEDSLLCGREAETYIQSLDRACEEVVSTHLTPPLRSRMAYLYVTWLIERRALTVYELYQSTLRNAGWKPNLTGLLAEELGHLASVEEELRKDDPTFKERSSRLESMEAALYSRFICAIRKFIHSSKSGTHEIKI